MALTAPEIQRRYRARHPDKIRERQRLWRQKHPFYNREYLKKWRALNPEKYQKQNERRKNG